MESSVPAFFRQNPIYGLPLPHFCKKILFPPSMLFQVIDLHQPNITVLASSKWHYIEHSSQDEPRFQVFTRT